MKRNAGRRPWSHLRWGLLLSVVASGLLVACPDVPQESWSAVVTPVYELDPENPAIPQPIDILGVTIDPATGLVHVDVPAGVPPAYAELFDGYINTLDGWSVNSSMTFQFSDPVQLDTVTSDTVIVLDLTGPTPRRLDGLVPVAAVDEATGLTNVAIASPLPLPAGATIGVVVRGNSATDGVLDADGAPVATPYTFSFLKSTTPLFDEVNNPNGEKRVESNIVLPAESPEDVASLRVLEALRASYAPHLDALAAGTIAGAPAIPRSEVVLFWTFAIQSDTVAEFDPVASVIPTPNNALFGPDGTLSFPIGAADPAAQKALFGWLNTLDGFSVLSAPAVSFSGPVDPATLTASSVRVFDVTSPAAIDEVDDLVRTWDETKRTMTLLHADGTDPFEHGHTYAAVVLSGPLAEGGAPAGVLTPEGEAVGRSQAMALSLLTNPLVDEQGVSQLPGVLSDADAQQFEPLRKGVDGVVGLLAEQFAVDRARIASIWTFTTGSVGESLVDPNIGLVPTPNDLILLESTIQGLIDGAQSDAERAFFTWLSQQGGWSGVINGAALFSLPLDPATIPAAFHVYKVDVRLGAIENIVIESPEDPDAPVKSIGFHRATAWTPGATYFVVVTDDLRTADGGAILPASFEVLVRGENALYDETKGSQVPALVADADAATLEAFRAATAPALGMALEELGKTRDNVLAHWTFTIQGDNEALFSPTTGFLPFPNEVLQNSEINAGVNPPRPAPGILLPIEVPADSPFADVFAYLATRDGFSVLNLATAPFLADLDPDSLTAASNIGAVPSTAIGYADLTEIVLEPGVPLSMTDLLEKLKVVPPLIAFDTNSKTLAVGPQIGQPLLENRRMMIEMTDKAMSVGGAPVRVSPTYWFARSADPLVEEGKSLVASLSDAQAVQLEQLRQAYAPLFEGFDAVGGLIPGFSRESVVLFWTYWTQSIRAELTALRAAIEATPVAEGEITGERLDGAAVRVHPVLGAIIDEAPDEITILNLEEMVVDGTIPGRYLLSETNLLNPADPQYGTFVTRDPSNPQWIEHPPIQGPMREIDEIAFDLYVPKQTQEYQAPFELVVYVHGIFGRRQDVLRAGLLDALLGQGFAVLAIDLPLHGARFGKVEYQGEPENASGVGFLVPDPLALRDHFVQGSVDLHQVANAISTGLDPYLQTKLRRDHAVIQTDRISLMGVSLGAIVATPFVATNPIVDRLVLHTPGGHFARVIKDNDAPWFQAAVRPLLCGAAGAAEPAFCEFDPGAPDFIPYAAIPWNDPQLAQMLDILQWVLDPADPVAQAPYVDAKSDFGAREVLIQVAGADDLFKSSISDELAAAVQYGQADGPLVQTYEGACHAFLALSCDGAALSFEAVREAARDDAVTFLRTGTLTP